MVIDRSPIVAHCIACRIRPGRRKFWKEALQCPSSSGTMLAWSLATSSSATHRSIVDPGYLADRPGLPFVASSKPEANIIACDN